MDTWGNMWEKPWELRRGISGIFVLGFVCLLVASFLGFVPAFRPSPQVAFKWLRGGLGWLKLINLLHMSVTLKIGSKRGKLRLSDK